MVRRAGVVALVLASVVGVGATAQAETSKALSTCAIAFCLYTDDNWEGTEEEYMFEGYLCYTSASYMNNKASSMRNISGARVQFYDSANCSGAYGYAASPHSVDSDLTNNGFDNKTSSIKYVKV